MQVAFDAADAEQRLLQLITGASVSVGSCALLNRELLFDLADLRLGWLLARSEMECVQLLD